MVWILVPRYLTFKNPNHKLIIVLILAFTVWGLTASGSMLLKNYLLKKYNLSVICYGLTFFIVHFLISLYFTLFQSSTSPKGQNKPSILMVLTRGLLAGIAAASSILLSHYSSPSIGGMAAIFPAIFTTTLVTVWISQGESVALGATIPLMMGMLSMTVYSMISSVLIFKVGVVLGFFISYFISVVTSFVFALLLRWGQKIAQKKYNPVPVSNQVIDNPQLVEETI
jgi:hypothetical protein